jgi:hypothetical protein
VVYDDKLSLHVNDIGCTINGTSSQYKVKYVSILTSGNQFPNKHSQEG